MDELTQEQVDAYFNGGFLQNIDPNTPIIGSNVSYKPYVPPAQTDIGGGGGDGGGGDAPPPPPPTPPDPWMRVNNYVQNGVKQASPDIVLFDQEAVSPEYLIQLEYEDISGSELINISRSDIINGQDVIYSPIKNLASWNQRYNPNNIIALPSIFNSYFSRYQIDLIFRGIREPYLNSDGDLVIEIDIVFDEELIEAEIDSNGTIGVVDLL